MVFTHSQLHVRTTKRHLAFRGRRLPPDHRSPLNAATGPTLSLAAPASGKGFPEFRRKALRYVSYGFEGSELLFNVTPARASREAPDEVENSGE
jgi:hypothetical protein